MEAPDTPSVRWACMVASGEEEVGAPSPLSVFVKSKESEADELQKPSFPSHTFQY